MTLSMRIEGRGLEQFGQAAKALSGKKMARAEMRAVNRAGSMGRTQVLRATVKETGLPRKTIDNAIVVKKATMNHFDYRNDAKGGNVRLKFFKPRETRKGVTAKPFGKRRLFAGTFMRGGLFPNRKKITKRLTGGNVYERYGRRFPVGIVKSDVYIPTEMMEGADKTRWTEKALVALDKRIAHELSRLTKGTVT